MKLAILGLLSCLCLCAQQAGLEGIAVDAVTQAPLAGVHISLISSGVGTNLAEPDDAYGAISNAAGHYSIGNIRPGTYTLEPKHTGYVYVPVKNITATPSITLNAGEQVGGYRIVMTPEATIRGRVIDEFGDPVQGVGIRAVSVDDIPAYGMWRMHDETDDRGEYRLTGLPGKYYIEAAVHPLQDIGQTEIRTDGSTTNAYGTTYYPGSLAKERAKDVEVAAGRELTGIDIHIAQRKSLKISGVVTGPHAAGATVTILLRHDGGEAEDDTTAASDGSFVFSDLPPSDYWLRASARSEPAGEMLYTPVVKITVENDDAAISLPLTTGETMTGSLQVEGSPRAADEQWTIRLTPLDPHGTPTKDGQVAADGSFVIGRVIPGTYLPEIDPLPENAYIKSLLLGGVETQGLEVNLTKGVGGSTMRMVVSRNGGQVSGLLVDNQGRLLTGRHVFIVLAKDPESVATWRTGMNSGAEAAFAIHGLRPGKYRLFAIDPLQFGGLRSYDLLKSIAAHGEEIEIKEGDRIIRELHLTARDGSGAK
jgi:hypothetical protein